MVRWSPTRANACRWTSHHPVFLGLDPSKSPSPTSRGGPLPKRHPPSNTRLPGRSRATRGCQAERRSFGPWLPHHGIPFRPRGFAPPRRFPPHRGFRACCIPVPDLGFAAFHARQATTAGAAAAGGGATRSRKRRNRPGSSQREPFEGLILAGSRAASLRPMPSCRSSAPATTATRTLAHPGHRQGEWATGFRRAPADSASRPFPPDAARQPGALRLPV
jgi:hypothetical protein